MFDIKFIGSFLSRAKKVQETEKRSKMGMVVNTIDKGSFVEQIDIFPRRTISKLANGYLYSLELITQEQDIKCMEISKEHVISSLATNPKDKLPEVFQAQCIARDLLCKVSATEKLEQLSYIVAHDTAGYGPISMLMEDKHNIEEIEISAPESPVIIYSSKYGRCITNLRFSGELAFRNAINRMIANTEKEISDNTPVVDAQVADLRIHAQMRPYAISGAAASIRIGGRKEIDLSYLISKGTASPDILAYLWLATECKYNMIVSGAPASGKTTLLSALNAFVPSNEKVITIEEDVNEINSNGILNTIALYGSRYNAITSKEQVINSLRMRPNRIIIGEMRGEEAKDLFIGANIGISFAATMHSNEGGTQILKKLLVRPMAVDPKGISALDIAIYMKQEGISQRFISGISEYCWLSRAEIEEGERVGEDDMVQVREMIKGREIDRSLLKNSKLIACYSKVNGIGIKDTIKEFERRSKLIGESAENEASRSIEKKIIAYSGW